MKKTTAWILVLTMLFAWVVLSVPALAETVTDDYAEGRRGCVGFSCRAKYRE